MIRNSLYNSYLPEAQKGKKQKEIKEGVYKMPLISGRHIFYYDPQQKQWYRKDTNPNAEIVDWQKVPNIGGLIDGKKGLNYYATLQNKEGKSPYLLQESAPENFKPLEDKGLIATDLGTETKQPVISNTPLNAINLRSNYTPNLSEYNIPLSDIVAANKRLSELPSEEQTEATAFGPEEGEDIYYNPKIDNRHFFKRNNNWYATNPDNTFWSEKPLDIVNPDLAEKLNNEAVIKKGKDKGKIDNRYIAADPTIPVDLDSNKKVPTGITSRNRYNPTLETIKLKPTYNPNLDEYKIPLIGTIETNKPTKEDNIYRDANGNFRYFNPNVGKEGQWYYSENGNNWEPAPAVNWTEALNAGKIKPIPDEDLPFGIRKENVTPTEEKKEIPSDIVNVIPSKNTLFSRLKDVYKDKYKRPVLNKETGLPEPPPYVSNEPEIKPKNFLDLGNNTYVYKDGDKWYSVDSGNRIYDPKVTEKFNKLFDIQNSQPSSNKPDVVSTSPTIINNYTYNTENNKWYDKNNEEIKDPVLISELQSEKGKKDIVQELLTNPSVNRKTDYVTPSIVKNIPKEEDLDTYIDPNKLRFTKEYLSNLNKDIEYSPSNRVVEKTPKEKKERRDRDFSFEFPDLSGVFTRRTKSKPDQKLTPAELQEYTVEDIYNPNNFSTLDVIKGDNITNLPSTYIPESVIPTMQSQYPIVLKEDPNAPARIIKREIDVEAPGGMGLAGFIHKPRQMKNKFQKRYGGELTDEDFDYTLDVDTNELVEYLRGGRLPKAQTGRDAKDILSVFNQDYLEQDTNPYSSQKNFTDDEIKNIIETPLFATSNFTSPNVVGKQPEVNQSNVYKMPEVVKNLPPIDVSNIKITPSKSYTPTVTNVPGLGNVVDRYEYQDSYNYKYNPRRIYDPSNQISYTSGFAPLAYNIGKGWMEKPEYVKTVFTPTPITEYAMGPNYLAIDEGLARIRDAANEQAGTGSRRLNTLIGAYMQGAKQKGEVARLAEASRLDARKQADLKRKEQQVMLDTAMQQNQASKLAAKVQQEAFREKTVEQIDKLGKQSADALRKEKADRLRIQATNQLVKDYELVYDPSTGEAKYKHIPSGTYMTQEAYTKMFTDNYNKMKADVDAKAKEKEASTDASIKAKEEQDKAKSTSTTNTKEASKKFGGWIKENQQYKKKRNRLYY